MIPTPTPLPPAVPRVDITGFDLWDTASTAVQYLNMHQDVIFVLQVIMLVSIILGAVTILIRALRQPAEEDSDL
jgi:hypothetical protein